MGALFSAPVQTGPRAHPASNTMGYRVFAGGKAVGAWRWPPNPSAEVKERVQLSLYPLWGYVACHRVNFIYIYTLNSDLRKTQLVPECEERIPTRCNNIDNLLSIPYIYYWLLSWHVSGIFMPIIRRKDHVLLHMGFFAGSVGCGWLQFCGATLWGVSTVKVA